jgi:hypothetical protein
LNLQALVVRPRSHERGSCKLRIKCIA